MEDAIERLQTEFIELLRRQIEALELDVYVGLTDAERSECHKRRERIRDLNAKTNSSSG